MAPTSSIEPARPQDHSDIVAVIDDWWGRPLRHLLPGLFLDHFHLTSFTARHPDGTLAGFLVGFLSPARPDEAYVHFIGVDPRLRGSGLGRELYDRFFDLVRTADRHVVRAVTSHVNTASVAFHERIGFTSDHETSDEYVLFVRHLD